MVLDALGEVLGGAIRLVGRILIEVVIEGLCHGTGWVVLKPFHRRKDPHETLCTVVGLIVWAGLALAAYATYRYVQAPL